MPLHSKDGNFPTSEEGRFAGLLAFGCTVPGTIVCGLVLIAYTLVASFRQARPCLDRISFRLLVYSLVAYVVFGIAYAAAPDASGATCDFDAFMMNLSLCLATFFTTCIAINLQLVLVHGVDGNKAERYYTVITILLSLALNVPTYFLNHFGYNEPTGTCWYKGSDKKTLLRWLVATESFWMALAGVIDTIVSIIVIIWLFRFQKAIAFLVVPRHGSNSHIDHSPLVLVRQNPKYRRVILRIALYPIASLLLNFPMVTLDLFINLNGVNDHRGHVLVAVDLVLVGLRPLVYGILAALDPAFLNAIQELRGSAFPQNNFGRIISSVLFANLPTEASTTVTGTRFTEDLELNGSHNITSKFAPVPDNVVTEPEADGRRTRQTTGSDFEEKRHFERQL